MCVCVCVCVCLQVVTALGRVSSDIDRLISQHTHMRGAVQGAETLRHEHHALQREVRYAFTHVHTHTHTHTDLPCFLACVSLLACTPWLCKEAKRVCALLCVCVQVDSLQLRMSALSSSHQQLEHAYHASQALWGRLWALVHSHSDVSHDTPAVIEPQEVCVSHGFIHASYMHHTCMPHGSRSIPSPIEPQEVCVSHELIHASYMPLAVTFYTSCRAMDSHQWQQTTMLLVCPDMQARTQAL